MKALELCLKAYGEGHMLYVRLCLNIGILYEDDRQFQEAYDYFIRWDKACMEVICYCSSWVVVFLHSYLWLIIRTPIVLFCIFYLVMCFYCFCFCFTFLLVCLFSFIFFIFIVYFLLNELPLKKILFYLKFHSIFF